MLYKSELRDKRRGWIKDKRDERDFLVSAKPPKEIPDTANLKSIIPPLRNQWYQSACTGHGIGGIITGKAIQKDVYTEWVSPNWIYYGGRLLGGYAQLDCGASPRLCLDFLIKYGVLLESQWPYKQEFEAIAPTDANYIEALKRPLLTYTRVVDGVDGLCSAIADNELVAIGSPWPDEWMETDKDGRLTVLNDGVNTDSGHEYYVFGYDRNIEYFNGVNSWGEKWGKQGKMLIPFQAINWFKKNGGYDAHIVDINWVKAEAMGLVAA